MNSKSMRRNRRKQKISLVTNIIFSLITLSALTGCIILLLQNYGLRNQSLEAMSRIEEFESIRDEYKYSQSDLDAYTQEAAAGGAEAGKEEVLGELRQKIVDGESTVSVFRGLFPEDVIVYADGGYHFFPVSDSLKKHDYVYDNFVKLDNNEIVYMDDTQEVHSAKGIDVSRHQGKINWDRVSEDEDISYAFIRAGYRGTSEGKLVEDEYFKDNIKGALDNDIEVGIYFYTQAMTEKEAEEEAEFVLDLIRNYDVSYPVVLDLEEVPDTARTAQMTQEEYTKAAIAFCEAIRSAGYTPMIYGNLKTFMIMLDLEQIEEYDKWFAYYDTPVYFPYEFTVWQYSSKGNIGGINGDVDMNVCMKDYAKADE